MKLTRRVEYIEGEAMQEDYTITSVVKRYEQQLELVQCEAIRKYDEYVDLKVTADRLKHFIKVIKKGNQICQL